MARGQTDLEFLVERILNRSDSKETEIGLTPRRPTPRRPDPKETKEMQGDGRSLPSTQTGWRRSRAHPGHLSRQSRSGNGPRLRPRHSRDGPSNHAPTRSVCTAAAVASLRAGFSHSCGINVSLASLGRYARTCERYHGLFSPGSRPTGSSQTLSASPTGLRARWACGLMVLGATKC